MKRLIVVLAAFLALPLMAGSSFAQAQTETPKPATAPAPKAVTSRPAKLHSVSGDVVSMDATAKTVVVKEKIGKKTRDVSYTVAEGAASTLSQLKAGDHVRVSYTMTHGKRTVESIVKTENKT